MTDWLPWLLLAGLLVLSGFFSASETALFSLGRDSGEATHKRVHALLAEPRELLVSILLGNLLVNLSFFMLAPRVLPGDGPYGGFISGLIALIAILVFGEILPKTLALRAAEPIARLAALPLSLLVAVLAPVRHLVQVLLDLAARGLGENERTEGGVSPEVLADVLEKSAAEGLLAPGQADLLAEIVELGSMRVREIMTPRVDMLAFDLSESPEAREATLREAMRRKQSWLPVLRGSADQVEGCVELRDLLADKERPLEQLVMPVKFVPEVARVMSLLRIMHTDRISEAVVVDEWGGTAGVVNVEDLFEELVGELRVEGEEIEKPFVPLGEGRFRVSGGLSIRDWNDRFGARIVPREFETVGGYVTALLGRIPQSGDRVEFGGGLVSQVHEVRGRRVQTLDLWVEGESVESEELT